MAFYFEKYTNHKIRAYSCPECAFFIHGDRGQHTISSRYPAGPRLGANRFRISHNTRGLATDRLADPLPESILLLCVPPRQLQPREWTQGFRVESNHLPPLPATSP